MVDRSEAPYLDGINGTSLTDVIQFLEPFLEASMKLQTDLVPTIHRVVYQYRRLEKRLKYADGDSGLIYQMKNVGRSALRGEWRKGIRPIHFAATSLDSRVKNTPAITAEQRPEEMTAICDLHSQRLVPNRQQMRQLYLFSWIMLISTLPLLLHRLFRRSRTNSRTRQTGTIPPGAESINANAESIMINS